MAFTIKDIEREHVNRTTGVKTISASIVADDVSDLPTNTADTEYYIGSDATVITNGGKYLLKSDGTWVKQPSETGFSPTPEQQDALDSGIDATKVAQIATNTSNIALKQNKLTSTQLNAVNSGATSAKITQITTNQFAIAGHDTEIMALSSQQSTQHTQIVNIQNELPEFVKLFQIFGGVGATLIPRGADLNTSTYAQPGCFICSDRATAESLINCPVNYVGFIMLVLSSGNRFRIILPTTGGVIHIYTETVSSAGTVFNPWYEFVGQNV